MWQLKKMGSLTFHLAFLIIVIGAACTRFFGSGHGSRCLIFQGLSGRALRCSPKSVVSGPSRLPRRQARLLRRSENLNRVRVREHLGERSFGSWSLGFPRKLRAQQKVWVDAFLQHWGVRIFRILHHHGPEPVIWASRQH